MPAATASRLAWSNTAPLGAPVDPLVQTMATGSWASSPHRRAGPCPDASASATLVSTVPDPGAMASPGTAAVSTTVTVGWTRAVIEACSALPMRRFSPVVMAPMRAAAW